MSSSASRPLLFDDDRSSNQGAWITSLRVLLRFINLLLAVVGLAMAAFAVYMYVQFKEDPSIKGFPWFIFAFGGAGLLIVVTASTALVGVAHNSGTCLGIYSFLMVVLLIGQAVLAVALFADNSWQKYLPHDDTGEAERLAKLIKERLNIVRWVGLAGLLLQVFGVILAYMLSSAQQQLLDDASDDEAEVWTRPESLPRQRSSSLGVIGEGSGQRNDAWSLRMREKYGLDTSEFSYDPSRAANSQDPQLPAPASQAAQGRQCVVM